MTSLNFLDDCVCVYDPVCIIQHLLDNDLCFLAFFRLLQVLEDIFSILRNDLAQ